MKIGVIGGCQQYYGQQNGNFNQKPAPSMSFGDAVKSFFTKYADFNGRAVKSEYWFAFLFNAIVGVVVCWIPVLGWLVSLGLLVPSISVAVRRLHDTGKAGTYYLMSLIPLAGPIILIVYLCADSAPDNQWGPAPMTFQEMYQQNYSNNNYNGNYR